MKKINPFVITGYVSPEYFCDRENESIELIRLLQNGNNVTLIASRRMGKTGLISHCFENEEIKQNFRTFFVDIYATKSLNDFVFLLSKNILSQLKPFGIKAIEGFLSAIKSLRTELSYDAAGVPSLSIGIGQIERTEQSLDEIFDYLNKSDKPCIVAIDEFQQIASYPEKNAEALLRTYVQRCPMVRFIFAGSQRHLMGTMFLSAARPFFASASMIYLESINRERYANFAQKHFSDADKYVDNKCFETIYDTFGGVTWYVQKVLNEVFSQTSASEIFNLDNLPVVISKIVESYKYYFFDSLFRLPDKQSKLLIAMAKEGQVKNPTSSIFVKKYNLVSASSVQAALNGLLEKDFITREQNFYLVYDRFFALWLKENY
ncbi:MAG: ATPase [Paludibacter sp.]|jgi:AAA+ ATPase superfamily predicted ATPase|nr:ATPase [Paludibacter sp.]